MLLISCHKFSSFHLHIPIIFCYVSFLPKPLEVDIGNYKGQKALYSLYETVVHEGPKALLSLCETMSIYKSPEAL